MMCSEKRHSLYIVIIQIYLYFLNIDPYDCINFRDELRSSNYLAWNYVLKTCNDRLSKNEAKENKNLLMVQVNIYICI